MYIRNSIRTLNYCIILFNIIHLLKSIHRFNYERSQKYESILVEWIRRNKKIMKFIKIKQIL